jgi:hypothetical protein
VMYKNHRKWPGVNLIYLDDVIKWSLVANPPESYDQH